MSLPLVVRLLLDAQDQFIRAVEAVPEEARGKRLEPLNTAGWVVAHAGFFHDVWINCDAQGGRPVNSCDAWLFGWFLRQKTADHDYHPGRGHGAESPIETPFDEARAALARALERATVFVNSLTDETLDVVPAYAEGAWAPGTTVGYFVSRAIAHLFAHTSELGVITTAAGGRDIGLPGPLRHTQDRS